MKTKLISCAVIAALLPFAARALDTGVSFAVYATPAKPYLEINIEIAAASVNYKSVDSTHLQAGVETLILIKDGERVVNYEKYVLLSPVVEWPENLLDAKRFALANGQYTLDINARECLGILSVLVE